jgi:hypothetical protein
VKECFDKSSIKCGETEIDHQIHAGGLYIGISWSNLHDCFPVLASAFAISNQSDTDKVHDFTHSQHTGPKQQTQETSDFTE